MKREFILIACLLATAGNAAPAARNARALAPLRVVAVSGDRQTARAFAASTGPGYESVFERPLVVRFAGAAPRGAQRVRFRCESRGCRFALSEQGDDVSRVDAQTYEVKVVRGRATLPVTLTTDAVPGTFEVRVRAVVDRGERAASDARLTLFVR